MAGSLVAKKVAVSILFDTVSIELICGDGLRANVLYDDLIERLQSGQELTLCFNDRAEFKMGANVR